MTAVLLAPSSPQVDAPVRPGRHHRFLPVAVLLVILIAAHAWNLADQPFPNDDEGAYISQAWAVQHGQLAHYTYWYDHPPLGWIQLAVLSWPGQWLLPGLPALVHGRIAMLVVLAITLLLVYTVARRLQGTRWTALLAMAIAGLSPLALSMQHQVYLDNFAVMWLLAAFALALSPRRHLWQHVAAGVATSFALLSKETIAIAVPAVIVALWQGSHPSTRRFSLAGFLSGMVFTASLYPLYAALKGELFAGEDHVSLLGTLAFQLHDRAGTGSVFVPGTEAHELLMSWLGNDPVLLIGGLAAAVAGLAVRPARAPALAVLLLVVVALRPDGYLPKMYIVQLVPFLALSVAGVATAVVIRTERGFGSALVTTALIVTGAIALTGWPVTDARMLTESTNDGYTAASRWLREEMPVRPGQRTIVDGVLWVDLVRAGHAPGLGAIWHYKIDLDPAVQRTLPGGWRDIDYVVSTPAVRGEAAQLPTLAGALAHSRVVATFGAGDGRIEVREVLTTTR
ncbi:glycosyltransferase family 39 protein [Acrocarpospora sp. B8E8]|uniref:ArnT family glycosyltransferase n=1 Tax=Acrocarpospora sp. B8E8 TaxID=3153572 RepID=UPI00325D18FA